jgi:hypothetical protein
MEHVAGLEQLPNPSEHGWMSIANNITIRPALLHLGFYYDSLLLGRWYRLILLAKLICRRTWKVNLS